MAERCYNCKFYEHKQGVCRRYPRVVIEGSWLYPRVHKDDWCGEYLFAVDDKVVQRNYNAPFTDLVDRVAKSD